MALLTRSRWQAIISPKSIPVTTQEPESILPGIEIVGSFDATVDDNTISESSFGIIAGDGGAGPYVPSTENLVISNNHLLNTSSSVPTGLSFVVGRSQSNGVVTEPANVIIKGNVIRNGSLSEKGVNSLSMTDNDVIAPVGATALSIEYYGFLSDPYYQYNVTIAGNRVRDLLGVVKVSIDGLSDYNAQYGFYDNIRVFGGNNSFSLVPTLANGTVVSAYQFYPVGDSFLYSGSSFPPGINFQVGDMVHSSTAPVSWIVTAAGSLGVASDTFTVSSASPCVIANSNSGSNKWAVVHTFGQLITVTRNGGTLVPPMAVGSVYFASSSYNMALLSPTTGAVDCTSLGSGSITATATVTYETLQVPSIRAGTWSISSSASIGVTFRTAMNIAPTSCAVSPSASAATTGTPFATSLATTGFTVNLPISGTLAGTYQCVVDNTN